MNIEIKKGYAEKYRDALRKKCRTKQHRISFGRNSFLHRADHRSKLPLLYGAHDTEHDHTVILQEHLKKRNLKI